MIEKHSAHAARDQPRFVRADTARRHTHVQALDVDRGAVAAEPSVQDLGEVVREIFLQLGTARDHASEPRQLREAEHFVVRDVCDRDAVDHGKQVMRADPETRVVLRDHHLAVLRRKRLREQRVDLGTYLVLVVDELVEAFGRALRRVLEVVVAGGVAKAGEALEDLVVTLGEERERLGIELDSHGVSS